jgi:hypothetical protein
MAYDETAAAWGLFIHFTWLADQVAGAVFHLGQGSSAAEFGALVGPTFGPNLADLEKELGRFHDTREAQIGLEHCREMRTISEWRNERINARVEIEGAGNAFKLYSWRTRLRLTINAEEIQEKTARFSLMQCIGDGELLVVDVRHGLPFSVEIEWPGNRERTRPCETV